jgi:glycosyltransferase involved in cell wall biosynthesis
MKLSIIVPVYNEARTVKQVIDKLIALSIPSVSIEIIIVDDGSTDATSSILKGLKKNPRLHIVTSKINKGKGAAVILGIVRASGEYIVIQDADLEYDPVQITSLVKPVLAKQAKVVYGTRLDRMPHLHKEEGRFRFLVHFFGNRFLSLVTSILYGQWITDMETCYKLFPKKALAGMKLTARGFEFEPEITAKLMKSGYKITEVPIVTNPRGYEEGKKLNTVRDGIKALITLISCRF